ncbi:Actin-interacting protein 1 [Portunus trituberculatus]|uniref:Actin-interacting protein 1 n=1 Tax=Portunus trituberculatus TaxID=210409 RepID=A0A5B7F6B7_PORTR|nr:Actin-interacting protein 1 [Portunus trituberculatus]
MKEGRAVWAVAGWRRPGEVLPSLLPPELKFSIWACLPRTQRGQPIVLGTDPKGKKLLYVHANSVIIRDIERLVVVRCIQMVSQCPTDQPQGQEHRYNNLLAGVIT